MKNNHRRFAVLLIGLLALPAAQADIYLGASGVRSSYDYDNIQDSTGWKAFGGVRLDNGLLFEAQYQDSGSADIGGQPYQLQFTSAAAFIGYHGQADQAGFFAKVGVHDTRAELRDDRGRSRGYADTTGLALGVGLSFAFNEYVALRGEVEGLLGVDDFSDRGDSNVWTAALGLEARF